MATSTNAPLILSIFGFYIIIIVLFGFIGIGAAASHTFKIKRRKIFMQQQQLWRTRAMMTMNTRAVK